MKKLEKLLSTNSECVGMQPLQLFGSRGAKCCFCSAKSQNVCWNFKGLPSAIYKYIGVSIKTQAAAAAPIVFSKNKPIGLRNATASARMQYAGDFRGPLQGDRADHPEVSQHHRHVL